MNKIATTSYYMARISLYFAALPPAEKKPFYTPRELQQQFKAPMQILATPLVLLGWSRDLCRLHGKPTAIWIPPKPQGKNPKRPRGRPSIASIVAEMFGTVNQPN